ncbi:hypothetical protein D3C75_1010350 [compost metagenome]
MVGGIKIAIPELELIRGLREIQHQVNLVGNVGLDGIQFGVVWRQRANGHGVIDQRTAVVEQTIDPW